MSEAKHCSHFSTANKSKRARTNWEILDAALTLFLFPQVSDLLSSLRAKWPTLACPTNDGVRFWGHEWEKHGTCAANVFDEHSYFQAALRLRDSLGVLRALTAAGVNPDGGYYTLDQIKDAISQGTGFEPYVECNRDESGNSQLYQLYFCVNAAGDSLVECPVLPRGRPCGKKIEFPAF
jgi:ribonuclease T2